MADSRHKWQHDCAELNGDYIDQICQHLDIASVVRLAACYKEFYDRIGYSPDNAGGNCLVFQCICLVYVDHHQIESAALRLNGFPCKRPENVTASDFFFGGLASPGDTGNEVGSAVTAANVESLPGLNTLGVSMARIDFAPWGVNPPHTHPRATEIFIVLEGSLDIGFVTTSNKLFTHFVCKGEVFVFPRGLVHFQRNNGNSPATVISAYNSQLQGTQSIAETLFGASLAVLADVLARAFQIDAGQVEAIKSKFMPQ